MTDEEYIRNRLDMINRNSVYGLMIDSEITKIVRSHIKRDIGCDYDRLNCPKPPIYIGPVKVKSLKEKIDNYKRRKKEMKATSVQNIKNVNDVCFSIENYPAEMESKLTIVASTNDDIFAFEFEGPDLLRSCKTAGLFTGCEKDQKIRELEKELNNWKKEASDCLRLRDEVRREKNIEINNLKQQLQQVERDNKRLTGRYTFLDGCYKGLLKDYHQLKDDKEEYEDKIEDLQHKYNLERCANEAQHKFFREYAGKGTEIEFNYAIDDTKEVSYVIVDKKTYDEKPNINLHGMDFTPDELVDRILELEKLKTPTIENFADEKPSDNVNHPSHYTGRYECIDVMQDVFGNEATDNFCLCNAFKYIWRANKKNGLEDVKKAVWYLNKYIEEAEKDGVRKGEQI